MDGEFQYCRRCGHQNPKKNSFCGSCGEAMKTVADIMGGSSHPAHNAGRAAVSSTTAKILEIAAAEKCPNCSHKNPRDTPCCKKCGMPLSKDVTVEDQGDIAVIIINIEQFDFESHVLLRPVHKSILRKKIVVDISKVQWMDSTGIGALVTMAYMAPRSHQEIKIVGMNQKIMSAVKSLQVENVLDISEDVNACRAAWGLPPV